MYHCNVLVINSQMKSLQTLARWLVHRVAITIFRIIFCSLRPTTNIAKISHPTVISMIVHFCGKHRISILPSAAMLQLNHFLDMLINSTCGSSIIIWIMNIFYHPIYCMRTATLASKLQVIHFSERLPCYKGLLLNFAV